MKEYYIHVSEPWFTLMKLKLKTCEGRLNKGYFADMKKDDCILFLNKNFNFDRSFRVKITSIHHYDSFESYLKSEKLSKCLPGIDTISNGTKVYYKYYNKEDEKKYGIAAIRLKVLK